MAQNSAACLTAAEARQNVIKDTVIHEERCGIESAILESMKLGLYEATISNGTPMTNSSLLISEVWTVDPVTNQLYIPNHGFSTGDAVTVTSTIALPAPLVSNAYYYVIYVDENTIRLAASYADAVSGRPVSIDITAGVTSVILDDPGTGYIQAPIVSFSGGNQTATAVARSQLSTYGGVVSIAVTTPGSGYNDQPTVQIVPKGQGAIAGAVSYTVVGMSISNSGGDYHVGDIISVVGGTGTAATATIREVNGAGAITNISLSNPGDYSSLPALTGATTAVMPGGGAGATVNLTIGIKNIEITNGGTGYIAPPQLVVNDPSGVGAVITTNIIGGSVTSVSVANPGYGYVGVTGVDFTSGSGADARAGLIPTAMESVFLVDNGGNTYTSPPSVTIATIGSGCTAGTVRLKVTTAQLTSPGTEYVEDDILLVSGGVATENAWIRVISVNPAGQIINYRLEQGGIYTGVPNLQSNPVIGGAGRAATFNLTMGLQSIDVGAPGSGYQVPPEVSIGAPSSGSQATAVANLLTGAVSSFTITDPGSGYTAVPTVVVSNGSGATAEALLTETVLDIITITNNGSGYSYANIEIVGGGAYIPAQADAVIAGGEITDIIITDPGAGYTSIPQVVITGDGNDASADAALVPTSVASVALLTSGSGYNHIPNVSVSGAATAGATIAATGIRRIEIIDQGANYTSDPDVYLIPGANQTGVPLSPTMIAQRGFALSAISVISPGSGYQTVPSVTISPPQLQSGTQATATAYIGTGAGTFGIRPYPTSRDYYKAWMNQPLSNNQLSRPYIDQMNIIITHFTNLGYTINRLVNPATNSTITWKVQW